MFVYIAPKRSPCLAATKTQTSLTKDKRPIDNSATGHAHYIELIYNQA